MPRWPSNYKVKHPERDYKKEARQHATAESTHDRVARNKARRQMEKEGRVHKGDGKEVDHKRPIGGKGGGSNSKSNLQVVSRSTNRKKQPKRK